VVSIVIPCYNQARFLREAIDSVRRQTVSDVEVIVVDDGSTDNTSEVAHQCGVRCLWQLNQGQGKARNTGLAEARGEFVVFLDADDRLLPNALETGLALLRERPHCAFVAGRCHVLTDTGVRPDTYYCPVVTRDHYLALLRSNFIWMPASAIFRTAIVREAGGFRTDADGAEDYDLYLRITRRHPVWCHDGFVAQYRQHATNTSRRAPQMLRSVFKVMAGQRAAVRGDARAQAAWREGVQNWRLEYGEDTVKSIRKQLRNGDWRSTVRPLLTLARYYPTSFWRHVGRKVGRVLRGQRPEALEDAVG
jgi:glycosyltransferase involved in cell wall biosynthesis